MKYDHVKIEKKWQEYWEEKNLYQAKNFDNSLPKSYLLVEFPYPSGDGLHVGHCRSYTAFDILARKRRMQGFNVLFPMGWDAFGLPTENYAIKAGIHPAKVTKKNTENFKRQQKSIGLSYDWSREINTTDPNYYKWTQWIFIKLWENGLAYKAEMPINWCPSCKIGLANEEVVNGGCERCGEKVVKKSRSQWMLKITEYADRLIQDLDLVDFPQRVKASQKEWIGKSHGADIVFEIKSDDGKVNERVEVFTTRPDTLFGATFLVLSPEHPLVDKIRGDAEVEDYVLKSKGKSDIERIDLSKEKAGVQIKGIYALNPVSGEKIPVWVADYVLPHYGYGAIMSVPAHDERDYAFAKKYGLEIKEVISGGDISQAAYAGEGKLVNSGDFNGLDSEKAREGIVKMLKGRGLAKESVTYKLRDWLFSRQHYWGEPIPMVNCKKCGWVPVSEKDLPVELPQVEKYEPTDTGESPLATMKDWVNVKCPKCSGPAERETDTMPNWAGSNWYFLRYCDPGNNDYLADSKALKYWMPVDCYNGGMEHTTLHLLYSRFIYKFLWDIKAVPKEIGSEPYKKRTSHGMILGEGGIKMSKSKGNVISPDEMISKYGADSFRLYEMFISPFEDAASWNPRGIVGMQRFLEKVWDVGINAKEEEGPDKLLHQTIKKVEKDTEELKFNTAISSLMVLINAWKKTGTTQDNFQTFLKIIYPFVPHISEELWQIMGNAESLTYEAWPEFDAKLAEEETIHFTIQINGKVREEMEVGRGVKEEEIKKMALEREKIQKWIEGKEIKKTIFVKDRLINFVI